MRFIGILSLPEERVANFIHVAFSGESNFIQSDYIVVKACEFLGEKHGTPIRSIVVLLLLNVFTFRALKIRE